MKILCWNVRGVGRGDFIQQVREWVNFYHPDIISFMETKLNSNRVKMIIKNFNFNFLYH